MVLTYVQQHFKTLRVNHRYVIASSTAAVASAQLVLNASSSPAPVAGSATPITLHVEKDQNAGTVTYKLVLMRTAAQTIGGDYFLRLGGAATNAQINGADAVFHLHTGLDATSKRLTAATGTDLANNSAVALAASSAAATQLLAFEADGLPLLSVEAQGGDGNYTAMIIEHDDSDSYLSVSGSGTSAAPFVVAFDATFASLTAAQKTLFSTGRTVSLTINDGLSRVYTGFFKVWRYATPAFEVSTVGGAVAGMAQNYTTYSSEALHVPIGAAYKYYWALSIQAGVGNAGTSFALSAPGDAAAQFVALDNTAKNASGIVLAEFNQDVSRGTKWETSVAMSATQTVGALSRTWSDAYSLMTASSATATRLGGNAAAHRTAFKNYGVYTLETITGVVAGGANSRCLRDQVGGGNVTVAVSRINGFGNSTCAYTFSDAGLSANSVTDSDAATLTSPISGSISNNNFLVAAEQVTCTATITDLSIDAPTGTGAAYPAITGSDVLSVYENLEANLKEGGSTPAYTANRGSDGMGSVFGTWPGIQAKIEGNPWWGDAASALTYARANRNLLIAYALHTTPSGELRMRYARVDWAGNEYPAGVTQSITANSYYWATLASGASFEYAIPAVWSANTGSALTTRIDQGFLGGYGTRTISLVGADAAYAEIQSSDLRTYYGALNDPVSGMMAASNWQSTAWWGNQAAAVAKATEVNVDHLAFIYGDNSMGAMHVAYKHPTQGVITANFDVSSNQTWALYQVPVTNLILKNRADDVTSPYTLTLRVTDEDNNTLTIGAATPAPTAIPAVYQRTFPASDYIGSVQAGSGAAVGYWYTAATLSLLGHAARLTSANMPSGNNTAGSEGWAGRTGYSSLPGTAPLAVTGQHPAVANYSSFLSIALYDLAVTAIGAGYTASPQLAIALAAEANNTITSSTITYKTGYAIADVNAEIFSIRLDLPQINMPASVSSNISTIQSAIQVQAEFVMDYVEWLFTLASPVTLTNANYKGDSVASTSVQQLMNETDGQLMTSLPSAYDLDPAEARIFASNLDLRITTGFAAKLIVVATESATTPTKADLEELGMSFTYPANANNSNVTDIQLNGASSVDVAAAGSATVTIRINPNITTTAGYSNLAATQTFGDATVRYYYLVLSATTPLVMPLLVSSLGHVTTITIAETAATSFADSLTASITQLENAAPNDVTFDYNLYQGNAAQTVTPPAWGQNTANSWIVRSGANKTQGEIDLVDLPVRRWKADKTGPATGAEALNYSYMLAVRQGQDDGTMRYSNWLTPTPANAGQAQYFNTHEGKVEYVQSTNYASSALITGKRVDVTEANAPAADRDQVVFDEVSRI